MILTIICPSYNEEKYIAQAIESFLKQQYHSFELEILIVDGRSTDNTKQIIEKFSKKNLSIKMIDNPMRKTPYAFNEGLKAAKGEYIAILGAHSVYAVDYLQTCFDELIRTNSAGCSGRVITEAASLSTQAKLCEWLMNNSFGVSSLSFRKMKEGYTHSVNFPVYKKKILSEMGGYNTDLERNQDNDLNQRILDAGNKLYCTWKTECIYRPPPNLKKLFNYAYRNGYWNLFSFKVHTRSMRVHHFVPFFFTSGIIILLFSGIIEYLWMGKLFLIELCAKILITYFVLAIIASIGSMLQKKDLRKLLLPFIFFGFHFSYGWGTIMGFLKTHKPI